MRRAWLFGLGVAACTLEVPLDEPDRAPTAAILTPSDGSQVRAGELGLRGVIGDPQDPTEHVFVVWSLGQEDSDAQGTWEEACAGLAQADGTALCAATVAAHHTRVRLIATDPAGYRAVDEVGVRVVEAETPVVELLAPTAGVRAFANVPVQVHARVSDADHPVDALRLSWALEGGPVLTGPVTLDTNGEVRGELRLAEGERRVILSATDPDGLVGEARLTLAVGPDDAPPTCRIDAPSDGAAALLGEPVEVRGAVLDVVTAPDQLAVRWTSDLEGELAEATPSGLGWVEGVLTGLREGWHTLGLHAVDEHGGSCVHEVALLVDTAPSVSFLGPAPGAVVELGQTVVVRASAEDTRSEPAGLRVALRSSLDGPRWTLTPDAAGVVEAGALLSAGVHLLTLTVTDEGGLQGEATLTVEVREP